MNRESDIADRGRELVEEFAMFPDWMDKYQYLIDQGRELPAIEDEYRTDEYRIRGCQSQVWLRARADDGTVDFRADSDALITKGLIAVLLRVLNHQPAEAVAAADLSWLDAIGMKEHLSPTRKNGLDSMIKQIRMYAAAIASQERTA
jgi:cysteine desulfuration protein SufE